MFASPWILGGMACYVAVMFLFTQAFRAGGTVTVLYPVYALTFIWAAIFGLVLFGLPTSAPSARPSERDASSVA
jgi:hypothetical protein